MKKLGIIVVILALLGVAFVTGYYFANPTGETSTDAEDEVTDDTETDTSDDIAFKATMEELDTETMMAPYKEAVTNAYYSETSDWHENAEAAWEFKKDYFNFYEVGKFINTESEYHDQKVIVLDDGCDGMCMYAYLYRFALDEETGELTYFPAHSNDGEPDYLASLFENKDESTIPELALPETISEDGWALTKAQEDVFYRTGDLGDELNIKTNEPVYEVFDYNPKVGKIYHYNTSGGGCFYVQAKDGSIARYDLNPGFFDEGASTIVQQDDGHQIDISNDYFYTTAGCGVMGNCYFYEEDVTSDQLIKTGETEEGEAFYVAKGAMEDATEESGASAAQIYVAESYESYSSYGEARAQYDETTEAPMTFQEYTALPGVVFWEDPLGRWVALIHNDAKLPAECGKPVIYLYPEETMDVHVQVDVDEFTVTVPDYGEEGWFVNATPDSEIYNYADGETYPYLFWEAHDYDIMEVDSGFVIAREEVPGFLDESLDVMGFTAQEKADFVEFWEPNMLANEEPYFYITFLGTREFDPIAPLTVYPEPDCVIRVFMYYDPIDQYVDVRPQELVAAPRYGFTLFEWGGTSSEPWEKE